LKTIAFDAVVFWFMGEADLNPSTQVKIPMRRSDAKKN
jgi:hypothetical protein